MRKIPKAEEVPDFAFELNVALVCNAEHCVFDDSN